MATFREVPVFGTQVAQNWDPAPQPNCLSLLFPSPQSHIKPRLHPPLGLHSRLPQKWVNLTLRLRHSPSGLHRFYSLVVRCSPPTLTQWQPTLKMGKNRTAEERRRYAEENGFNNNNTDIVRKKEVQGPWASSQRSWLDAWHCQSASEHSDKVWIL